MEISQPLWLPVSVVHCLRKMLLLISNLNLQRYNLCLFHPVVSSILMRRVWLCHFCNCSSISYRSFLDHPLASFSPVWTGLSPSTSFCRICFSRLLTILVYFLLDTFSFFLSLWSGGQNLGTAHQLYFSTEGTKHRSTSKVDLKESCFIYMCFSPQTEQCCLLCHCIEAFELQI